MSRKSSFGPGRAGVSEVGKGEIYKKFIFLNLLYPDLARVLLYIMKLFLSGIF